MTFSIVLVYGYFFVVEECRHEDDEIHQSTSSVSYLTNTGGLFSRSRLTNKIRAWHLDNSYHPIASKHADDAQVLYHVNNTDR